MQRAAGINAVPKAPKPRQRLVVVPDKSGVSRSCIVSIERESAQSTVVQRSGLLLPPTSVPYLCAGTLSVWRWYLTKMIG